MSSTSGQTTPQPISVFYSYDPHDEPFRLELEKQLRPLQRQGLIRPWHQHDISAGEERQHEIATHLASARIIVLLISPDFLASDYCYSTEMQQAMLQHEDGTSCVIPLLLRPVAYEGAPFSKLQLLPRDGVPLNQWADRDEAWRQVIEELRTVIANLTRTAPPPTPTAPVSHLWHVPYRRNPFFTGREAVLARLHDQFTQEHTGQTVALSQSLAINGLGGIGKTQIALEYAYRYRQKYQTVLWITAATPETLLTDFLHLATLLSLPERQSQEPAVIIAAIKRWLATASRWLLILDNADDLPLVCSYLPESEPFAGHVLLTTRAQAGGELAQMLPVEEMSQEEGALLLLRRAKILSPGAFIEQARTQARSEAEEIVKAVGGLPLAIDQAGAYIEETGCSLATYLTLYSTRRKELLQRRSSLPSTHPEPVTTTWSLSFRLVEQANPAAAELLRACAFLDADAIPEDLLREGGVQFGPPLDAVLADPFAFNQALEALRKFSLIRRNAEARTLSVHRLVQAVLRDELAFVAQQQWAERIVEAVNAAYPPITFETWEQCRQYLPHALGCATLIEHHQIVSSEAAQLLNAAGWYLYQQGFYMQAEPLLQQALAVGEQAGATEQLLLSHILNDLATLYQAQGKYEQAELLFLRSLAIDERSLGPDHPNTSATLNNLALLYLDRGKYEQAEPLFLRSLAIYEQSLRPDHPNTSATLDNLASLYRDQGKYERAELTFLRALAIREQSLGPDHPDTSTTLNNLALLYWSQSKCEQAEPLFLRSLAIKERSLGPDHPRTAVSLYNLAHLYQAQARYEQSEQYYQHALAIDEHAYGPDHPEVATDLEAYAQLLFAMKRDEEAARLLDRARRIRETHDDPLHDEAPEAEE